jgi:hypothetical protein
MKAVLQSIALIGVAVFAIGCASNGPAHAEDVTAQIKAMPPEKRFELIKSGGGMSPQMKAKAIDELPVSEEQKSKWKAEIGVQ